MKKIVLAAMIASLGSVSAFAADLPARTYTKAPAMVAPISNWSGFYIGGHFGSAWDQSDWTFPDAVFWIGAPGNIGFDSSSWLAGAHVGYNYQIDRLVIGLEGTWSGTGLKQTVISPFFPDTDTETTKVNSVYTIAARLGATFGQFLAYGKGGWAGGQVELSAFSTNGGDPVFWNPGAQNRNGWVAGGGVEYMLTPNFILGVEYNHIDLGSAIYSANNTGADTTPTVLSDRTKLDTVVGRLSYKFGPF
jgi:outer membrane immunogenic protein